MTTRKPAQKKKPAPKPTTAQIVASAKLPNTEVPLCVRGDLMAAYQAAEKALAEALTSAGESFAGAPYDVVPLAQAVEDIRQEMADYTLNLVVQALPPRRWKELQDEHPPRRNDEGGVHDEDRRFGVDVTTFFPNAIALSVIEPDDLTPELWDTLLGEKLTNGQIEDLCTTVWLINQGKVSVPFSPAVSKILSTFGKR